MEKVCAYSSARCAYRPLFAVYARGEVGVFAADRLLADHVRMVTASLDGAPGILQARAPVTLAAAR